MRFFFAILFWIIGQTMYSQDPHKAFGSGEWFKFRIHYGIFTASYATLEVKQKTLNNIPVYHVIGKGKSSGLLSLFFKVKDRYSTYIDTLEVKPYKFTRKIYEGGHTKDLEIAFDHQRNKAEVFDKKHKTHTTFDTGEKVQDMMSAFYHLRNQINTENLKKGDEYFVNMFFDNENYKFKLRFLGKEVIRTKMGKMHTLKFRPFVQADRVFKEEESLTVWVSDDANRMPLKIRAEIVVGAIEADLIAFKGLKHPFTVVMQ